MGEESDLPGSDFSYQERIRDLIPRIINCYVHLKEISNNRDALLAYADVEKDEVKKQYGFKFATEKFYSDCKFEGKMDSEKAFFALKKYTAMLYAKIRIRERDNQEFSVQCLSEYLRYISGALKQSPPKILEFIDFSKRPAVLNSKFREYMELGESELVKLCEERHCSDRNQVLLSVFADAVNAEIDRIDSQYFISEGKKE